MAIKFDGLGTIVLASPISFGSSEKFRIAFPDYLKATGETGSMALVGTDSSFSQKMGILVSDTSVRMQINGYNSDLTLALDHAQVISGLEVGRKLDPTKQQTTYNGTTYFADAVSYLTSINMIGAFTENSTFRFIGEMAGVLNIYDDTDTLIHSYDFEDDSVPNQLTDSVGGNHGTMANFGTGYGFVTATIDPTDPVDPVDPNSSITLTYPTELAAHRMDAGYYSRFVVSGTFTGTITDIYHKLDGGTGKALETLTMDEDAGTFMGTVLVPNGPHSLELYATNDVSVNATVATIRAVYSMLYWGQSNGNGAGANNQSLALNSGVPYPLMCGTQNYSQIEALKDPTAGQSDTPGSMWPKFVSYLVNDTGLLVCITNTCVNGSALSSWMEGGENHDRPERLAELVGGYDAAISVIGESDSGNSEAIIYERMNAVINSYKLKYGCDTYITYVPRSNLDSYDTEVNTFGRVIDENRFAKFGGYLGVVDVDTNDDPNITADGTHMLTDAQLTQGAQIVYDAFKRDSGEGYYQSDIAMTLTNASGEKPTRVIDIDTGKEAFFGNVEWLNGSATIKVNAKVGANVEYYIMDDKGGMSRGVTV